MSKTFLVSLVSEQTIPNVELIKEFEKNTGTNVFITTKQMEKQLQWIINATKIKTYDIINVNPFDISDIENKINNYNFGDDDIILNITGGTKLMSLVISELFKNLAAKSFYVTGHNKTYIKVFPNRGEREFKLNYKLSLREYLSSYGFEFNDTKPYKTFDITKKIFEEYLKKDKSELKNIFEPLRLRRGKKKMSLTEFHETKEFLKKSDYLFNNDNLNKKDIKYLSGDWFEEYVFYKIKNELDLADSEIATGLNLKKEGTQNEIDVIFIYNHKLFIIECKTSIVDLRPTRRIKEGKEIEEIKEIKLLPEIIYKSDALRGKFGLFANTSIFTLEEIKNDDSTPTSGYETHFQRAALSRINILSRKDIISKDASFKEKLHIR